MRSTLTRPPVKSYAPRRGRSRPRPRPSGEKKRVTCFFEKPMMTFVADDYRFLSSVRVGQQRVSSCFLQEDQSGHEGLRQVQVRCLSSVQPTCSSSRVVRFHMRNMDRVVPSRRSLSGMSILPNPRFAPQVSTEPTSRASSSGASRPRRPVSDSDSDGSTSPPPRRRSPRTDSRYK